MVDESHRVESSQETTTINFESGDFQLLGRGKFDPSQVNTMPVVHFLDGKPQPLGTCFVISNEGLAITARHVVDEAFGHYFRGGNPNISIPDNEALHAIYASNEVDPDTGHFIGGPLPIVRIWANSGMDIAILQLSIPTDTRTGKRLHLPLLQLSPGVPKVGEHIFGFGYHTMKWTPNDSGFEANQRYSASRGVIQQVHFPFRDRAFMSFPCFETSARFDGGMSGGPIISMSGQVCGVICSSIKTDQSDGTFTSYGSLIAPALAIAIWGRDNAGIERDMFLHDFVAGGAVAVDDTYKSISVRNTGQDIFVDLGEGRTFRNTIKAANPQ